MMNQEQAEYIISWREEGASWRRISELFCESFPDHYMANRCGNQAHGRMLLEEAIIVTGIDPDLDVDDLGRVKAPNKR